MDKKQLIAYHFQCNLDLKRYKSENAGELTAENSGELFYKVATEGYYLVFSYGVVVCYNCSEVETTAILQPLLTTYGLRREDLFSDGFDLLHGGEVDEIAFDHVTLRTASRSAIRIVMLNLAQSLALRYYNEVSQDLLGEVKMFTNQMEAKGTLKISRKNIMRFIGKTLNAKNRIVENLYIFDSPPVTWEDEYVEKINAMLSQHLELRIRYRAIASTFDLIESNLHAFSELFHQKESSKLEWIIIILILVEVIDTFVTKLL